MRRMRNRSFVACGLAFSFVASTISAETIVASYTDGDVELQVIRQTNPVAGLESYRLRTIAAAGNLNTFKLVEPVIDGSVHQCEHWHQGEYHTTVLLAEISSDWAATGWTSLHTEADTHLLLANDLSQLFRFGSDYLVEGNNGQNPYGLPTNDGLTKVGLGQLTGGSDIVYARRGQVGTQMDLMQVVIPRGTLVHFSGGVVGYLGGTQTYTAEFLDIPVGVPEPSTLALVLTAVLALVAMRRRIGQHVLSSEGRTRSAFGWGGTP